MQGIKRGKVLIYDGFRYQKNRATGEKIHWRCWRKGCRAKLNTNLFDVAEDSPDITVQEVIKDLLFIKINNLKEKKCPHQINILLSTFYLIAHFRSIVEFFAMNFLIWHNYIFFRWGG